MATKRLEVGIILRLGNGTPPIVIGSVGDDEALLVSAMRAAIRKAQRQALPTKEDLLQLLLGSGRNRPMM